MIHKNWIDRPTIKQVKCKHTDAEKYIVDRALSPGKIYDLKNETDEFYFIVDNTGMVGGYYKTYFED